MGQKRVEDNGNCRGPRRQPNTRCTAGASGNRCRQRRRRPAKWPGATRAQSYSEPSRIVGLLSGTLENTNEQQGWQRPELACEKKQTSTAKNETRSPEACSAQARTK